MSSEQVGAPEQRFRELYAAHAVALLGYAARRVERTEDASDVVADVFLTAWRRIGDVPHHPEDRLWLYGVARNVLSNHRRGTRRRNRLADRLRDQLAATGGGAADHFQEPDSVAARRVLAAVRHLLTTTASCSC